MKLELAPRRTTLALSLSGDGITGTVRRGAMARIERVGVALTGTVDDVPRLHDAFAQLRTVLGASFDGSLDVAGVDVALLPPLADARLVPLPPLRPAEAQAILRRDASRYFVGIQAPHIVAVLARRGRAGAGGHVLAAAANAAFVEGIAAAAEAAGWRVRSISPAHIAWTAAAAGARAHAIVAVAGDTAHIVRLTGHTPAAIRRVPVAAADDIVAAARDSAAVADGARVAIYAGESMRPDLARAFSDAGWTVTGVAEDAAAVAARLADTPGMRLVSAALTADRRAQDRRLAVRLLAGAALLVALTGAVAMFDARREQDAIRGRRAEIRAQVGPLLALRDSIDRLTQQTADIHAQGRETPRWTRALFDIALLLPPESHLTALFATGDTLVIEAEGAGAGTALQALRSAGSLRDARLIGTVERELDDGATSIERFRLSARLADTPAAPVVARDDTQGAGQ